MLDEYNLTSIRVKSGANPQYGWFNMGFTSRVVYDGIAFHNSLLTVMLVPTATSIVLDLGRENDGDDIIYVYKQ